jgi:hypothetical protein
MLEAPVVTPVLFVQRVRRRLSRFFARVALLCAVGPIALALLSTALEAVHVRGLWDTALVAWIFGWIFGTPLATILALLTSIHRRRAATSVEVGPQAVTVVRGSRREVIPRRRIAGALQVALPDPAVELVLAEGDVMHVEVAEADAARALVTALGYGGAGRRTLFPFGDEHAPLAAGCGGVLLGVLTTVASACGTAMLSSALPGLQAVMGQVLAAVFVVGTLLFVRLLTPKRIVVGNDGVLIERSFRKKFIPMTAIRDVTLGPRGLSLVLHARGLPGEMVLTSELGVRVQALHQHLVDVHAQAMRTTREETSGLVARGGRSVRDWRDALRRLAQGATSYRGEQVSSEALLVAAASADAPADERVGAAMAIAMGGDEEAKHLLRIAVEGTANERVRVALERAAAGAEDEAALEEALEAAQRMEQR